MKSYVISHIRLHEVISRVYGSFPKMDEVKDILKDFLVRIEHTSANSAAGQSSTAESSARDSASLRSAEQSQRSSLVERAEASFHQLDVLA